MDETQYRHGDILVRRVSALPEGVQQQPRTDRGVVLAYGEVTGHAHVIKDITASEWRGEDGRRYVLVDGGVAVLDHEEHGRITLEPGVYEVIQQREYVYGDETRNVAD